MDPAVADPSAVDVVPDPAEESAAEVHATVLGYLRALGAGTPLRPFLADDVVFEVPGSGSIRGASPVEDALRHHYEVEFQAAAEVVSLVVGDRGAAAELMFEGVHTGEYQGVAATGRRVRVPLAMFFQADRGSLNRIRVYFSPDQVMMQLRSDPASRGDHGADQAAGTTEERSS